MSRCLLPVLFAALAGCEGPIAVPDGGMPLVCVAPQSISLVPSTTPSVVGVPTALISWRDGTCVLATAEPDPDLVVQVFDLEDTILGGLAAATGDGFRFESTSSGTLASELLMGFARDTDVMVTLSLGDELFSITFRLETGDRLVLLDMRRV